MITARTGMAALALIALLAGCRQQVAGVPSASGQAGPNGADSVLASFDPCTVLNDAKIADLGFHPETRRSIAMWGRWGAPPQPQRVGPSPSVGRRLPAKHSEIVGD